MNRRADIDRLRKRREFLAAATGRKWAATGLILQARNRADDAAPRIGFTVTRKVGSAVIRNRARRRLRAAASEILPLLAKEGYDYVLVGRAGTLTRAWPDLLDDLRSALAKVHANKTAGGERNTRRASSRHSDGKKDELHG
jgi:ribonuclease P protein component